MAKMNEATVTGGPERLAQTLEGLTGIQLDYYRNYTGYGYPLIDEGASVVQLSRDAGELVSMLERLERLPHGAPVT